MPIHTVYGFSVAILDFRLKEASEKVGMGNVEKLGAENMEVAAGILFLSSLELEKPVGVILPPPRPVVTNVCKIWWVYKG